MWVGVFYSLVRVSVNFLVLLLTVLVFSVMLKFMLLGWALHRALVVGVLVDILREYLSWTSCLPRKHMHNRRGSMKTTLKVNARLIYLLRNLWRHTSTLFLQEVEEKFKTWKLWWVLRGILIMTEILEEVSCWILDLGHTKGQRKQYLNPITLN